MQEKTKPLHLCRRGIFFTFGIYIEEIRFEKNYPDFKVWTISNQFFTNLLKNEFSTFHPFRPFPERRHPSEALQVQDFPLYALLSHTLL